MTECETAERRSRVLYVDDSAYDRALVRHALERESGRFVMIEAVDREAFEKTIREGGFDVVLTDFNILGFEGLEVIRMVRQLSPRVPVIVVTGTGSEEIAVKALKEGADDYVIKTPAHIAQLPDSILRALEMKRLQTELEERQADIGVLLDHLVDAILVVDLDGTVLFANPAAERVLGRSVRQLLGTALGFSVPAGSSEEIDLPLRSGGAGIGEMRIAETVWEGKECRVVSIRDITDRKHTEDMLRTSEAQLRNALEMSHAGHWAYDVASDTFTFNDNFYKILRTTAEQVGAYQLSSAEYARRFCHPEDAAMVAEEIERAVETADPGYSRQIEHRILYADGGVGFVTVRFFVVKDAQGRTIKTYGVNQDITEQKRAERQLVAREATLNGILRAAPTGIGLVLTEESGERIVFEVNDRVCQMLCRSREEIEGKSARILYPTDEEYERVGRVKYEQIRRTGIGEVETQWVRGDGAVIDVLLRSSPIDRYDATQPVVFTVLDITERKRTDEERKELQQQLQQAQKLESIGRLAGGVAHDFNNILSVILGYGEILLDKLHQHDPMRQDVQQIVEAGQRAATLTRQLLAFGRKQALSFEVMDPNALIRGLENMLQRVIGEDIALELALAEDTACVLADPGQVEQVIMNLVVNARDAMPRGGRLLIETGNVTLDEARAARHPEAIPGDYVMLAVTDTGCGMSPEVLTQAFEPFFTTKEEGRGTGLGLSTVYGIVRQSGGNIWVSSEQGRGTSVKVHLPRAGSRPMPAPARLDTTGRAGGSEHVLVVEDEQHLRELMASILSRLGYRATLASNGGEALLLVEERGLEPDLIITDAVMPNMSGIDLIRRLKRGRPRLKAICMSGYADEAVMRHGVLDPDTPFIHKPFSISEIASKIREVLAGEEDQASV